MVGPRVALVALNRNDRVAVAEFAAGENRLTLSARSRNIIIPMARKHTAENMTQDQRLRVGAHACRPGRSLAYPRTVLDTVRRSVLASSRVLPSSRTTSCACIPLGLEPWWRRGLQHRRPGVRHLPSLLSAPGHQSGHQHLDNCRGIVVGASATWLRHGSVAPWGAAGCRPAVFRHRGFDSLPTHHRASRLTGRAPGSYPGRDWVRGPGRAPRRRSSAG